VFDQTIRGHTGPVPSLTSANLRMRMLLPGLLGAGGRRPGQKKNRRWTKSIESRCDMGEHLGAARGGWRGRRRRGRYSGRGGYELCFGETAPMSNVAGRWVLLSWRVCAAAAYTGERPAQRKHPCSRSSPSPAAVSPAAVQETSVALGASLECAGRPDSYPETRISQRFQCTSS